MFKKNTILILAVALVFFAALAFWLTKYKPSNIFFQREIQKLETQSSSDEVGAIEGDLEETDLSNLDKELGDIEKEIEAAYQ
ncbi:MAG: hypothetical protein WBE27_03675 [Microgenomates group bacterium]